MATDIWVIAERETEDGWQTVSLTPRPFGWSNYAIFGFLAGVQNYAAVPPISQPRGAPDRTERKLFVDGQNIWPELRAYSWLTLSELLNFAYEREFENRRFRSLTGTGTAAPGEGVVTTFRAFLGPEFFTEIERLLEAGAGRIVFGFDA